MVFVFFPLLTTLSQTTILISTISYSFMQNVCFIIFFLKEPYHSVLTYFEVLQYVMLISVCLKYRFLSVVFFQPRHLA